MVIGELQFEAGDRVRVVTSDTPFFGWTGTIVQGFRSELEFQKNHYTVQLDAFSELPDTRPCLFREMQLRHSL